MNATTIYTPEGSRKMKHMHWMSILGLACGAFVIGALAATVFPPPSGDDIEHERRLHRQEATMAELASLIDENETQRVWLRDVIYVNVNDISDWDKEHRIEYYKIEDNLASLHDVRVILIEDNTKRRSYETNAYNHR